MEATKEDYEKLDGRQLLEDYARFAQLNTHVPSDKTWAIDQMAIISEILLVRMAHSPVEKARIEFSQTQKEFNELVETLDTDKPKANEDILKRITLLNAALINYKRIILHG